MFLKRVLFSCLIAVFLAVPQAVPAHAAPTPQLYCEGTGGVWDGTDAFNGTCTWEAGTDGFVNGEEDCTGYDYYYENWESGHVTDYGCANYPDAAPDPGGQNRESTGGNNEGSTLTLPNGGSVTFPPGSCPQKCTISPNLPVGANDSLPDDALATLYVRVVDEGGTPGTGSYTACFDNPDGDTLTIYRYIGGVWTAIQVSASNPICVTASGDGAFYLGG